MSDFHRESLKKEFGAFCDVENLLKEQEAYHDQQTRDFINKRLKKADELDFDTEYGF